MLLTSQSSLGPEMEYYASSIDLSFFGIQQLDTQLGEMPDSTQTQDMHITPESIAEISGCLPWDENPSTVPITDPHWPSTRSRRLLSNEGQQEQTTMLADTYGLSDLPTDLFDELYDSSITSTDLLCDY